MKPYYEDDLVKLYHGDCIDVLRELPDASVDSIVTDPPYGLGFMGREWDNLPPGLPWAQECLRVLKPGGHLLAFGGTRTWHRLACAVEDAGFEVRDSIAWMYGSGFPKSLDVSKAIDKMDAVEARRERMTEGFALGRHIRERRESLGLSQDDVNAWFGYRDGCQHWERQDYSGARVPTLTDWQVLSERLGLSDEHLPLVVERDVESQNFKAREVVGLREVPAGHSFAGETYGGDSSAKDYADTTAHSPEAKQWQGWGTALKPAFEPVVVARKPLTGTVAANVLAHGTGALNIAASRTNPGERVPGGGGFKGGATTRHEGWTRPSHVEGYATERHVSGRWPANVILDESQAAALDEMSGETVSPSQPVKQGGRRMDGGRYGSGSDRSHLPMREGEGVGYGDTGGASRFFFIAREDNESCPNPEPANTAGPTSSQPSASGVSAPSGAATSGRRGTERLMGSPSTSATPTESRPSAASGTPTTPTTAGGPSHDWQPVKPSQMVSPARYAASLAQTDTTTTTTSPSTSDGSADPTTSSTTPTSAPGVPLDDLAERFRYVAKAPTDERPRVNGIAHPTTKPLTLMRWLVRLVTPPGGTVLEPFAGSGTTVEACLLEGFRCVAIEREADYLPLIVQRIQRRRDPVAAVKAAGDDAGLFDLLDGEAS